MRLNIYDFSAFAMIRLRHVLRSTASPLCLICFHSPQFLPETESFASIKDSLGFSALCDLRETFIKKIFEKISLIFRFLFERFSVEEDGFFVVSSW